MGIFLGAEYESTRKAECTICGAVVGQYALEAFIREGVERQKQGLRGTTPSGKGGCAGSAAVILLGIAVVLAAHYFG